MAAHRPTYNTWYGMFLRCTNTSHPSYPRYGARGISVCEAWQDFARFVADMGNRPEGTTLDRIDNNKGYEPGNCRWATSIEQARNKPDNTLREALGESKITIEWADDPRCVVSYRVLRNRLARNWPTEAAITTPATAAKTHSGKPARPYRGVRPVESGRFEVAFKNAGRDHYIGRFDTAEEAARAYDAIATQTLGDKAVLNFPPLSTDRDLATASALAEC
jgi:hypothetical protein